MSRTTNHNAKTATIDPVEKRTTKVRIPTTPAVIANMTSIDAMSYYLWEAIIHEQTHIVVKWKLLRSVTLHMHIIIANPFLTRW